MNFITWNEIYLHNMIFRYTGIRNYWISEYGDVINRDISDDKILTPFITNDNHLKIELKIAPGIGKKFFIHRLVYLAFVGPLIEGMVVEHLDSNPFNNHYTNLKLSTQKENIQTAINFGSFGKNHCKAICIRNKYTNEYLFFDSISECCKYFNISGCGKSRLLRAPRFTNTYEIIDT